MDIWIEQEAWPAHTAKSSIGFGDAHEYRFELLPGTEALTTRLTWANMAGQYPISDIDVILTPPSGPVVNSCNTGRAPELCTIETPAAGTWTARGSG